MSKINILYASDIHNEHRFTSGIMPFVSESMFYSTQEYDAIVLAGDITNLSNLETFIESTIDMFPGVPILYTTGNHEYYHRDLSIPEIDAKIRELDNKYPDFHYLQNRWKQIKDFYFFGGTMWSDFDCARPILSINDEESISFKKNKRLTVDDARSMFYEFKTELELFLNIVPREKAIVFSHFSPTPDFDNPFAATKDHNDPDYFLKYYFCANLSNILENSEISPKVWIYGHTHYSMDETLSSGCRIVSNQFGYPKENKFYQKEILEHLVIDSED